MPRSSAAGYFTKKRVSFAALLAEVSKELGMTEDELTGRERRRVITAGRSVICHLAARELGKRREASFYPLLVLTFLPPKPLRGGTMVKEGEKFSDRNRENICREVCG